MAEIIDIENPERKVRTCASAEGHLLLLNTDPEYRKRRLEIERSTRQYYKNNKNEGLRAGVVIIPVVVHVVYNTDNQNISDAQINSQIDVLNEDYRKLNADANLVPPVFQSVAADARIQFQLAVRDPDCQPTNGITRTFTDKVKFIYNSKASPKTPQGACNAVKFSSTGGHDAWPADRYLNIWVCDMSMNPLGYSSFPGFPANVDGVVIDLTCFGTEGTATSPFDKGR
jgi:hypothetical protein